MISPNVRRALHQALDLVLDAVNEDAREEPAKRRRAPSKGVDPLPVDALPPHLREQVERQMAKAGYRRTG